MHFLDPYINIIDEDCISVSAKQGCNFAKNIAGDFNPIHDSDSKRFCVPGDLVFSEAIRRYGLHQSMEFNFLEMLSADSHIRYSNERSKSYQYASNRNEKKVMDIHIGGSQIENNYLADEFTQAYVRFSALSFPTILVPLMKKHHVMINVDRPLIVYKSMSFNIFQTGIDHINIELIESTLEVDGKRGNACFIFSMSSNGSVIGKGMKKLILSGLREFNKEKIKNLTKAYLEKKKNYTLF
jgi:hypothetical protein